MTSDFSVETWPYLWSWQLQTLNLVSNSIKVMGQTLKKICTYPGNNRTLAINSLVYKAQIGLDRFGHTFPIESLT